MLTSTSGCSEWRRTMPARVSCAAPIRSARPWCLRFFNPAEIAGRRIQDARVYFSRYAGPVKRRHVAEHRDRLGGIVALIGIREPQLHAKFLTWDKDHVIVSSMNWGSQSGLASNRLDEIGLYLRGPGLATRLLERLEAELEGWTLLIGTRHPSREARQHACEGKGVAHISVLSAKASGRLSTKRLPRWR